MVQNKTQKNMVFFTDREVGGTSQFDGEIEIKINSINKIDSIL